MKVLFAPCGINCAACARFASSRDPEPAPPPGPAGHASDHVACRGCRRDGAACLDPECPVRECSSQHVDVVWCAECPEFACALLTEWAQGDPKRELALFRLRGMHADMNGLAAPT